MSIPVSASATSDAVVMPGEGQAPMPMDSVDRLARLSVQNVLNQVGTLRWARTIGAETTAREAAERMREKKLSSLLVTEGEGKAKRILGIMTERDLLFVLARGEHQGGETPVSAVMTRHDEMVYATPDDAADEVLHLMMSTGVRFVPVLEGTRLLGVITLRDLVQVSLLHDTHRSTKAQLLANQSRTGLTGQIRVAADLANDTPPLRVEIVAHAVPHPRHGPGGRGEDAHCARSLEWTDPGGAVHSLHCLAVADGVGAVSVEDGLDGTLFAHRLVELLLERTGAQLESCDGERRAPAIPEAALAEAWDALQAEGVVGGSTVCMAYVDAERHLLRAVNLGDSGLLVLRDHSRMEARGTLQRQTLSPESMHVVFRSPQTLHDFNYPYQLGLGTNGSIGDLPSSADAMAVHLADGDVVLLATDGLYDNVDEVEIIETLGDGTGDLDEAARALVGRASELSRRRDVMTPFARLAQEENILWRGGREDDITVVLARVSLATK